MHVKQRGSGWSIKLAFNLYKLFGYKFIYIIMYPVSFFYFIFASNVKKSLKIYYKTLNLEFNNWVYFEHLRMFAMCLCDRFISKYDPSSYTFVYENGKKVSELLDDGTILLFSHFGGWASSSSRPSTTNKINIVMKEVILNSIKNIETNIENTNSNIKIIDQSMGQLAVSIEIANAISNKEVVAIMADRPTSDKYKLKTEFFGKDAFFNKNPFKISYKTRTPILCAFVINTGLQVYKVKSMNLDLDFTLKEDEAIDIAVKQYVKLLEDILLEYPNQWFNFYNFWEKK